MFNGILSLCLNVHCHYVERYAVSVFKSILSLCLNVYCQYVERILPLHFNRFMSKPFKENGSLHAFLTRTQNRND